MEECVSKVAALAANPETVNRRRYCRQLPYCKVKDFRTVAVFWNLAAAETPVRVSAKGRFETLPWLAAPTCGLAQVPPADLHVPVVGQLALAQLPLGDALEPRPPKVVRLDAALGGGPLRQ